MRNRIARGPFDHQDVVLENALNGDGLAGGRHEACRLILFNIDKTVEHATAEFQIFGADPFGSPAFKRCLTDIPALGEVSLVEMNDLHAGLRTGWWESMKALFRQQAKSAIGNDVDFGSTAGFGFELRHDC